MFFRLPFLAVGTQQPATTDPTLNLCTRYPLRLGGPRQCGIWSLPDTSTHGQHWESNPRPSYHESNALSTWPHAPTAEDLKLLKAYFLQDMPQICNALVNQNFMNERIKCLLTLYLLWCVFQLVPLINARFATTCLNLPMGSIIRVWEEWGSFGGHAKQTLIQV